MEQLDEAIRFNDVGKIKQEINKPDIDLNQVLLRVIDYDNYDIIELVLRKGADDYNEALMKLTHPLSNHNIIPLLLQYYELGIQFGDRRISYDTFRDALDRSINDNDIPNTESLIGYVSGDDIINIVNRIIYVIDVDTFLVILPHIDLQSLLDKGGFQTLIYVANYLRSYKDVHLTIHIPVVIKSISLNSINAFMIVWSFIRYKPKLWQVLLTACDLHSDRIVELLLSTESSKLKADPLLLLDLDSALSKVMYSKDQNIAIRLLTSGALFQNDLPLLVYCVVNGLGDIIQYLNNTLDDQSMIDSIRYAIDHNYRPDIIDNIRRLK